MVLVFLRDWRSVVIVVLNIPFALCGRRAGGVWLSGQTINLMTLGGLALAVGILVDEATVEIENIHHRPRRRTAPWPAPRAARQPGRTAVPRLLAMPLHPRGVPALVLHAGGRHERLFVPLSLAVGFAMVASYLAVEHVRTRAFGLVDGRGESFLIDGRSSTDSETLTLN